MRKEVLTKNIRKIFKKIACFFKKIGLRIANYFKARIIRIKQALINFKNRKNDPHYISGKDAKAISRHNHKEIKKFEKISKRKNVDEKEYLTEMKDENNIVEFDDLNTFLFTDVGTVKAVDGVTFSIPRNNSWGSGRVGMRKVSY
jgi:hypothetical protein